jgi:sRNA-binding protein
MEQGEASTCIDMQGQVEWKIEEQEEVVEAGQCAEAKAKKKRNKKKKPATQLQEQAQSHDEPHFNGEGEIRLLL